MMWIYLIFLFSLLVSVFITWKTEIREKKMDIRLAGVAIGSTLARALAFFVIVYLPVMGQPRISRSVLVTALGTIIMLFGAFCIVAATRELSKTTFRGGKGIPEKVITTGPYSVVRHPATVGFACAYVGWSLLWGGLYALYLAPVLIIGLVIETFWEEKNLEKALGDEYKEYKQRVGMFFPKIRGRSTYI